jgi:hypothetical protein
MPASDCKRSSTSNQVTKDLRKIQKVWRTEVGPIRNNCHQQATSILSEVAAEDREEPRKKRTSSCSAPPASATGYYTPVRRAA